MGAGAGGDDFVVFEGVRIVRSTASDLCCWVAGRIVWLPRRHVSGELRARGDRGTLSIRRWIAHDRALIAPSGEARRAPRLSGGPSVLRLVRLHLVGST